MPAAGLIDPDVYSGPMLKVKVDRYMNGGYQTGLYCHVVNFIAPTILKVRREQERGVLLLSH